MRFKKNRRALPAVSLSTDTSALTAIGNDFSFEKIFSRQIEAIGTPGDIAIAITTSGNSKNLIEAAKIAKQKKIYTFCFSGNNGGKLKKNIQNFNYNSIENNFSDTGGRNIFRSNLLWYPRRLYLNQK